MAAVPPFDASACATPTYSANSRSSAAIWGATNPASVESAHRGPSSSTLITARLSLSVTIGQPTLRLVFTSPMFNPCSTPRRHAFIDEPAQLPSGAQRAWRAETEIELEQL